MQGESSQKNEKDLKNGASTKDKNQKIICTFVCDYSQNNEANLRQK